MKALPLRVLLAVLASLVGLAAAATAPRPVKKSPPLQLESAIPARFEGWQIDPSIVPVPPAPDVKSMLDNIYEQVLARTYVNVAGERVMLSIAYGGDQRDALRSHRQEVCYRAQGFTVAGLSTARTTLGGRDLPVTRFNARMSLRAEPVTYWMTMGEQVITSRIERLLVQVASGLRRGEVPDGMVVRVSSLDLEPRAAYALHTSFLEDLLRSMPAADAQRLTGR